MTDIFSDNEDKDYLAELTGPGGKFDRTRYASEIEMYKAIAKGKVEADKTIAVKNEQFDQLREDSLKWREEALAKANLEDYNKRLENQNTNQTNTPVDVKPIDMNQITELAKKEALAALTQLELQRKQEANLSQVETKLRERYGEKAKEVYRERMNALNLTPEDAKFLAAKSPEALINALNLNSAPPSYEALPRGSSNSDSFRPSTTLRDAIYYEDLRREKPKEYFSEKVSVQRIKDMDHPDFLKRFYERQNSRAGGY